MDMPPPYDGASNFPPPEEELRVLLHDVAETMIRTGNINEQDGNRQFMKEEDMAPYTFSCTLPPRVVQDVIFPGEGVIVDAAEFLYAAPHRIGVTTHGDDRQMRVVSLVVSGHLRNASGVEIDCSYDIVEQLDTGDVRGLVSSEYIVDGMPTGRDALRAWLAERDDPFLTADMVRDAEASFRDMIIDDVNKLRELLDATREA